MSKTLLQINVTANWGSTGRIAEQINLLAHQNGWSTYIAYGRYSHPSQSTLIHIGSNVEVYEHYAEYRLFDNDGLASRFATIRLIKRIKEISPDIIHLHNIHDHWLNYRILFEFLNTLDIPIIWTQHDCWGFTGDCGYYSLFGCNQWENECTSSCPMRRFLVPRIFNHTTKHFHLKKKLFNDGENLTLVPVSKWLENEIRKSFLKDRPIQTIYNGVDIEVFHPSGEKCSVLKKYGLDGIKYILGVATSWSKRKGFSDYCQLASLMPKEIKIVLVGLDAKQRELAAQMSIVGISRTENVEELVALYNGASIIMNLSSEETFGLTTVEGLACGTPAIVYNATASPELITPETGAIVSPNDIQGVANAVEDILKKGKKHYLEACRKRAVDNYNQKVQFQKYIDLYNSLLNN